MNSSWPRKFECVWGIFERPFSTVVPRTAEPYVLNTRMFHKIWYELDTKNLPSFISGHIHVRTHSKSYLGEPWVLGFHCHECFLQACHVARTVCRHAVSGQCYLWLKELFSVWLNARHYLRPTVPLLPPRPINFIMSRYALQGWGTPWMEQTIVPGWVSMSTYHRLYQLLPCQTSWLVSSMLQYSSKQTNEFSWCL